jgi:hypothetical protein
LRSTSTSAFAQIGARASINQYGSARIVHELDFILEFSNYGLVDFQSFGVNVTYGPFNPFLNMPIGARVDDMDVEMAGFFSSISWPTGPFTSQGGYGRHGCSIDGTVTSTGVFNAPVPPNGYYCGVGAADVSQDHFVLGPLLQGESVTAHFRLSITAEARTIPNRPRSDSSAPRSLGLPPPVVASSAAAP